MSLKPPKYSGIKNPCGKDGNEKLVKFRKDNMARAGIKEGKSPLGR